MTESVNKHLSTLAEDLSEQISAINDKQLTILHVLASMDIFRDEETSLADKQAYLANVPKRIGGKYENLAFYDAEGNAITADGRVINFKARPYFSEAFAGRDFISDPTFSTVTNSVLQHYSVPVYNNKNQIIGAIVMVINGNALEDTIKTIDLGNGYHPFVLNNNTGATIAAVDDSVNTEEARADEEGWGKIYKKILNHKADIVEYTDNTTKSLLICAYSPVEGKNWTVCAIAPYDKYYSSLKRLKIEIISSLLGAVLISVILIFIVVHILVRPLGSIKKALKKIGSGNADLTQRLPKASNDEIGDVVIGFNRFVSELQEIVQNLQTSKDELVVIGDDLNTTTHTTTASIT